MILRSLAAAAALAAASLPATASELQLEPEQIAALFPGHYEAYVTGGYRLLIAASEDGSMQGKAFGREDTGQWALDGEKLCVSWRSWTRGKPNCGTIEQFGDWYVALKDGKEMLKFKPVEASEVRNAPLRRASRD